MKMSLYFRRPYEVFVRDINVEVHLSNFVIKTDIKIISHVDTSSFPLKSNIASLKTEVVRLDIENLKNQVDK